MVIHTSMELFNGKVDCVPSMAYTAQNVLRT